MMKRSHSLVSLLLIVTVLMSCIMIGCRGKTSNASEGSSAGNPTVVFGNEPIQKDMSYSISGADSLKVGSILGKEYFKLDSKDVNIELKLSNSYAKKFAGKPLFIMLEYYNSNSKDYTLTYASDEGYQSQDLSMSGTSAWGGKAVRIDKFVRGDNYDFAIKLKSANQLWIRSICVKEDITQPGTYPQMIESDYETSNGKVIQGNVLDYGATGNGVDDDSIAFQTALSDMAVVGGALYVPAGTYRLTQELVIPNGVTLLGDFNAPSESNSKVNGTVLALAPVAADEGNEKLFFTMRSGSCLKGLTMWYPEQTLKSGEATEYPYTIGISEPIGTTVEDIYLVNSYKGITHESTDAHFQQMVRNIYGTPLHTGYFAGRASDSDRQENIQFSPAFWLGSGLPDIPDKEVLSNWLLAYGTAFSLGDIDFHFVSDLKIRGYKVGLFVRRFYGRVYNFEITDCNTCMYVENAVIYGSQLTKGILKANAGDNPVALLVGESVTEGFTANGLTIESTGDYALNYLGSGAMSLFDSTITVSDGKAGIHNAKGNLSIINTTFTGGEKSAVFEEDVTESTLINCSASNGELSVDSAPESDVTVVTDKTNKIQGIDNDELAKRDAARAIQKKGPASAKLFVVSETPSEETDISTSVQKAIDEAYAAGGGVVYVPKGAYRLEKPIVVKSGVELQGATDYFHYVRIDTTVFLTDYGKENVNGQPLITIEENAGVRGFNIIYDKVTQETIKPYAVTMQGKGKNVYIINVTAIGGWTIADLNTNRCDSHYVDGLNFFTFHTGIAVGGGSENGVVINTHSNPGELWDCGYTDYEWDSSWEGPLMTYLHENVTGFHIGKTKNEVMFMTFIFGSKNGIRIDDGADVYAIGHGSDFSAIGVYVTGNSKSVIFDPQLIGSYDEEEYKSNAIVADKDFKGTTSIFNTCAWNIKDTAIRVDGGDVNLLGGTILHGGQAGVYATGGKVSVAGMIIENRSYADIFATGGTEYICAFGNLPAKAPKYTIAGGVSVSGSDLK